MASSAAPAVSGESAATLIGQAIRSFREQRKLSQKSLAEQAALGSHQVVSQIESGAREVKAVELSRISRALFVPIDVLLAVHAQETAPRVLWRRRGPAADGLAEARLLERARRYATLEDWCGEESRESLPTFTIDPTCLRYEEAGQLANRVSQQLGLGRVPAKSLAETLADQYGVKVFYDRLGTDGNASAACVRDDADFGSAVLINADEPVTRRAFSLAHELFHLVTWDSVTSRLAQYDDDCFPSWYSQLERCAQSFAACLLIPADDLAAELSRRLTGSVAATLPPAEYAFIARARFAVSTDALLWRLVNQGHLTLQQREAIAEHPEARVGRWTAEDDDQTVFPARFWELIRLAYEREEAGVAKLAEMAEVSVGEMHHLLTSPDVDTQYHTSARESTQSTLV